VQEGSETRGSRPAPEIGDNRQPGLPLADGRTIRIAPAHCPTAIEPGCLGGLLLFHSTDSNTSKIAIWLIWLIPQLFISAGCGITTGLLMVLTLFTVSLPCQTSIPMWIDTAEGLMAIGTACLVYGTTRRVVLARRSAQSSAELQ
jgi:hypothetical protein